MVTIVNCLNHIKIILSTDPTVNFYFGPGDVIVANNWTNPEGPNGSTSAVFGLNQSFLIGSYDNFTVEQNCQTVEISIASDGSTGNTNDEFVVYWWNNVEAPCNSPLISFDDLCGNNPNCVPCSGNLCNNLCDGTLLPISINIGTTRVLFSDDTDNTITEVYTNQTFGIPSGNAPLDCNNDLQFLIQEDLLVDQDWCMFSNFSRAVFFEQGKKIIIPSGVTARFVDATFDSCSDIFWDAIVVEEGGTLLMSNCTFKDGNNAIRMERGATVRLTGCNFSDNYVGIFLDDNTPGQNTFDLNLRGNSFQGSGFLAQPYQGQNPVPIDLPRAGIELTNVGFANLSAFGFDFSTINIFDNMRNGIVSTNSSFIFGGSQFSNMIRTSRSGISGYGIFATNRGGSSLVQQMPSITEELFTNMHTAIFLNNVSASIDRAVISNVTDGIRVRNGINRIIDLKNSIIAADRYGIHTSNNSPHFGNMMNNQITVDSEFTNATDAIASAGILCEENELNFGGAGWQIDDNVVNLIRGDVALAYTGSRAKITNNQLVNTTTSKKRYTLLDIDNAAGSIVSCNIIGSLPVGDTNFTKSTGVNIVDSPFMRVACNDVSAVEDGFTFSGPSSGMDFRVNSMANNGVGLQLDNIAVIGTQDLQNNCFSNNGLAALHFSNDEQFIQMSHFRVLCASDGGDDSCICPPLSEIQTGVLNPLNPDHFFSQTPFGEGAECEESEMTCLTRQGPVRISEPADAISLDIAANRQIYNGAEPQLERMMQYDLFRLLAGLSEPIEESSMIAYHGDNVNSNLGKLHQIASISSNVPNQAALHAQIKERITVLSTIEEAFSNNDIDETVYYSERSNLLNQLSDLSTQLTSSENIYQADLLSELETQESLLDQIYIDSSYDANMVYIMSKVLAARHPEFVNFTEQEWQSIYTLASQCSKDAGHAVYWARTLYNNSQSWTDFSALQDCGAVQARSNKSNDHNSSSVEISPNPSADIFMLQWPTDAQATIRVLNLQGKILLQNELSQGDNTLDLSLHPSGIYYYSILQDGNTVHQGKLLLID